MNYKSAILWVAVFLPCTGNAIPVLDQTGNLIINGHFEANPATTPQGTGWRTNSDVTAFFSSDFSVDGEYSAFIDTTTAGLDSFGEWSAGLWQYHTTSDLSEASYTVSAWFYPIAGQAYIGLQWNYLPDPIGQALSAITSRLNEWQYLEVTAFKSGTEAGGVLLYGLANADQFYVDGVWMNQGEANLSPYAPRNGFTNSNPPTRAPEPTTTVLLILGLVGVSCRRCRRVRQS